MRNLPASDQASQQQLSLGASAQDPAHTRNLINVHRHGGREVSSGDLSPTAVFYQAGRGCPGVESITVKQASTRAGLREEESPGLCTVVRRKAGSLESRRSRERCILWRSQRRAGRRSESLSLEHLSEREKAKPGLPDAARALLRVVHGASILGHWVRKHCQASVSCWEASVEPHQQCCSNEPSRAQGLVPLLHNLHRRDSGVENLVFRLGRGFWDALWVREASYTK